MWGRPREALNAVGAPHGGAAGGGRNLAGGFRGAPLEGRGGGGPARADGHSEGAASGAPLAGAGAACLVPLAKRRLGGAPGGAPADWEASLGRRPSGASEAWCRAGADRAPPAFRPPSSTLEDGPPLVPRRDRIARDFAASAAALEEDRQHDEDAQGLGQLVADLLRPARPEAEDVVPDDDGVAPIAADHVALDAVDALHHALGDVALGRRGGAMTARRAARRWRRHDLMPRASRPTKITESNRWGGRSRDGGRLPTQKTRA